MLCLIMYDSRGGIFSFETKKQMVFYFTCCDPQYTIYMGKDKYENEELLKYGFAEDIWFHVDDLSSAHVYLRRPIGQKLDDVNPEAIAEMCQLVKNNSIEGSKASKVDIIYTEFANLRKSSTMDIGTVSFHDPKLVVKVKNVERDRDIVKNIEKSRNETYPDLAKMKSDRDLEEKNMRRKEAKDRELKEKEDRRIREQEADVQSYRTFMNNKDLRTSNKHQGDGSIESCKKFEDDFW